MDPVERARARRYVLNIIRDTGCPSCGADVTTRGLRLACVTCGWVDTPPNIRTALARRGALDDLVAASLAGEDAR